MEWISVKDRMPETSGLYLVHGRSGYMAVVQYSTFYGKFNAWDESASRDVRDLAFDDVTHWMPLPAPPTTADEAARGAEIAEPYREDADEDELLAFPLCSNVEWKNGWRRVRCPRCGRTCWLRPAARALLKERPALVWACTACADAANAEPDTEPDPDLQGPADV